MKLQATDTTILILIRMDSIERLENTIAVIQHFQRHIDTNIYLLEADKHCNGILQKMVGDSVRYEFVEDDDPVLYKTWYFNRMLKTVSTPFVAIWDVDTIAESTAIGECIDELRKGNADISLPYNGVCLDTSRIFRTLYLKKQDEAILVRNIHKMNRLSEHILVGGAVMMNRQKFITLGGENEAYYGWGDDDYDRYVRFMNHGLKIYRSKNVLFHLTHPRGINSRFNTELHQRISKGELHRTQNRLL
jgi:predicted glycosyltransferase involved in capsule biosynthesis